MNILFFSQEILFGIFDYIIYNASKSRKKKDLLLKNYKSISLTCKKFRYVAYELFPFDNFLYKLPNKIVKSPLFFQNLMRKIKSNHKIRYFAVFDYACTKGYVEVVKLLLNDYKVDPSDYSNYAIRGAISEGCEQVVKLLLKDERVNPNACSGFPISEAIEKGYTNTIKVLLNDKRVDFTFYNEDSIVSVSKWNKKKILELLLKDGRTNPNLNHNAALEWAHFRGYVEIARLLLNDERVYHYLETDFIRKVCVQKSLEILKLLLENDKINMDFHLKQLGKKEENKEIIKFLLEYKKKISNKR